MSKISASLQSAFDERVETVLRSELMSCHNTRQEVYMLTKICERAAEYLKARLEQ